MKRVSYVIVSMMGVITFEPRQLHATTDGPDYYAVTGVPADDVLNIHAEPSAKGEKVGKIPYNGHGVRNLGCKGGPTFAEWQKMSDNERERAAKRRWCKIRYNGTEGWVAGWFLTEDSGPPPAKIEDTPR